MNTGKTLFAQIMDFLPWTTFTRLVSRYGGDRYALVAIIKKRLNLDASLYTLLQILSVTLFEKMPLQQAFTTNASVENQANLSNQMILFDF